MSSSLYHSRESQFNFVSFRALSNSWNGILVFSSQIGDSLLFSQGFSLEVTPLSKAKTKSEQQKQKNHHLRAARKGTTYWPGPKQNYGFLRLACKRTVRVLP